MTTGVKELRTVDEEDQSRVGGSAHLVEQRATAPAVLPDAGASMFERLARDPNVDVEKMERLMAMQERIMAINREAAFEAAFSKMQPAIPVIDEHGRIEVKGTLRSTYAPLEDIHDVIKPILAEHGFSIRHRTEWPADKPGIIRIVGILGHEQGHREFTTFEAPMDRSDYRTDIQSQGSTVSYGRRYTTLDLLNISTRKADTDGRRKPAAAVKDATPTGFDDWWADMSAAADNGVSALERAWSESNKNPKTKAFLAFATKERGAAVNDLKRKAGRVAAS
jgi:hypothetical protein